MKTHFYARALAFLLLLFICTFSTQAQSYTANFSSAPSFTSYPGMPSWIQTAEITLGGVAYQVINSGNGGWAHSATGGNGNSANIKYVTAATSIITIKRTDNANFTFYGAWLKYTNYTSGYTAPWLTVTYNGSTASAETYGANTTVALTTTAVVSSVDIMISGLNTLYFDDLIVGPAPPTVSTSSINQFTHNSLLAGGNVSSDGGSSVTERGVVYNTTGTPTIASSKIVIGSGTGSFSQSVTGLSAGTTYYIRAYATSSVGTGYGSQQTITTAANFVLAQTHKFNSSWITTATQNNPFTKYVEGWEAKATGTNSGFVSIIRITGISGIAAAGEGAASLRVISINAGEDLVNASYKVYDGRAFDLESLKFKYLTKIANTSFGTITVTGYKNGSVVAGAVATANNIAQATAGSYAYTKIDMTGNNNFNDVDQFIITASNSSNGARLSAIDLDELVVQDVAVMPAQYTEPFETFTQNQTSFTSNGYPFTLAPSTEFIVDRLPTWGYNSSNQYLSNLTNTGASVYSMKTTNSTQFTVKSIWLYPSSDMGNNPTNNGDVTIVGKKNGVVQFTRLVPAASFNGTLANVVNRGFTFIDFSAGSDYSNTNIDELEFTLAAPLNYFALDNFSFADANIVMPLNLLQFAGRMSDHQSLLSWETSGEMRMLGYSIEHSTDNRTFNPVGYVHATNNATGINQYTFLHKEPTAGKNYYKLNITDMDGKSSASKIIMLQTDGFVLPVLLYPNPVTGNSLFIDLRNLPKDPVGYRIYDQAGKKILAGFITRRNQESSVSGLPDGIYYIELSTGESGRFIRKQ